MAREDGLARVAVLLNRGQDAARWRERHAAGETMDVTPYGYERAGDVFDLSWSESRSETVLGRSLRLRLARALGFDIVHAWRNRRLIFGADVVWTHTEREHLAVALLQRFRRPSRRVPVLAQSVWLWDAWASYSRSRRAFVAWLLRAHSVELVHSRLNRDVAMREVPGRRVLLVPFGTAAVTRPDSGPVNDISLRSNTEVDLARPFILAVGNDADRDWATLAAAAHSVDAGFRIASRTEAARGAAWPDGTTVAPSSTLQELASLYRAAAVVVVPLRANLHASGATACIEALAAQRPLVVTDVGGIGDYVAGAADLVPGADPSAMAAALEAALRRNVHHARRTDAWVDRGLTQEDYVGRYVLLTRWLLGSGDTPAAASSFAPVDWR